VAAEENQGLSGSWRFVRFRRIELSWKQELPLSGCSDPDGGGGKLVSALPQSTIPAPLGF
jgi:hypothetical protein